MRPRRGWGRERQTKNQIYKDSKQVVRIVHRHCGKNRKVSRHDALTELENDL